MKTFVPQRPSAEKAAAIKKTKPIYRPWLMLFSRLLLFTAVQALLAAAFYFSGLTTPWESAANWWPFTVTAANLICLALLVQLFHSEGKSYWALFRIDRAHIKEDMLAMLIFTICAAPIAYFPNVWLGQWLFGHPEATLALFVRPLPLWAAYTSLFIFPISQGVTEIAMYFGYVMPRLAANHLPKWWALSLPALLLGLQHVVVPLLFDGRFMLWRALMYIPFAFFIGLVLQWRPRLLPYLAIIHVLMNISFATMFLSTAY